MNLHLGCGPHLIDGWINVDQHGGPGVTEGDVRNFRPAEAAEFVYAGHVLEHLSQEQVPPTLKHWHSLLKDDGQLFLAVPDFNAIIGRYTSAYAGGEAWWDREILGPLFGGDDSGEWSWHKSAYDFLYLKHLLIVAGFRDVVRYDPNEVEWHPRDWAFWAFSLNVKACR